MASNSDDEDEGYRDRIPAYDISSTLARHGKGSTAADSRRQRLANIPSNEEVDNDVDQGETAAEKRRRLAALGMGSGQDDESSSDEDVDAPRVPKEHTIEEPHAPVPVSPSRPRVQWGGESGRERGRERDTTQHHGLRSVFHRDR